MSSRYSSRTRPRSMASRASRRASCHVGLDQGATGAVGAADAAVEPTPTLSSPAPAALPGPPPPAEVRSPCPVIAVGARGRWDGSDGSDLLRNAESSVRAAPTPPPLEPLDEPLTASDERTDGAEESSPVGL